MRGYRHRLHLVAWSLVLVLGAACLGAAARRPADTRPAKASKAAVAVSPSWHVLGPLTPPQGQDAFAYAFPPETLVDLTKPVGRASWTERKDLPDGAVHPLPGGDVAVTYLYRTILAPVPTTITAYLGSDDGLAVWLNGRKVLSQDVRRSPAPNQDTVKLALAAGENRLLLKVVNRGGGYGFYFSTDPTPRYPVTAAAGPSRPGEPAAAPVVIAPNVPALRRAVTDLAETFGDRYPRGREFLARLEELEKAPADDEAAQAKVRDLQAEALLANPLLDFDRLLFIRRSARNLGLPQNWLGNCALRGKSFDNEIAVLSPVRPGGTVATFYRPAETVFVGDVDLHWDADRMLFSSVGAGGQWHVFEIGADGKGLRQVTPDIPDVNSYDACYLPDGRIIFGSTGSYQGIPCIGGGAQVANLYRASADGTGMRQLGFDQDHNWCPTVLNDGRVLYLRWEYSDTPHYFTRILFRMNPDGTSQMACYGSNSYWPNSLFYARPIPGDPAKIVGVISGHHGVPRMGELVLFDTSRGQTEGDGVLQRIPGWGRPVEPIIRDQLVSASWPRFLHPWPLSDKYFLVSCQVTNGAPWGLYLVDAFDNMLCLVQEPGYAMLEPVPFKKQPRPPVIPDKVNLRRKDAIVYLADIYAGKGLEGVPRGTVKRLRLFAFDYGYRGLANHTYIGIDGPWDVHRILGTVPVESDGSAAFRVPANTPIAVQPLDAEGKALQVMRSWFTAMPGENLSCVGCHERLSDTAPVRPTAAMTKPPQRIEPWYGPARGLSFPRDVQPVLDHHCVKCHNGQPRPDGRKVPDLRADAPKQGSFSGAYAVLQRYVNRPGPESDYHILPPCEYHADASELIQMLQKGHGGVRLDAEAWDRLVTWIDLNIPCHGTWGEFRAIPGNQRQRRVELRNQFAGIDEDYEAIPELPGYRPAQASSPAPPRVLAAPVEPVAAPGWPFGEAEAKRRQAEAGGAAIEQTLQLGLNAQGQPVTMDLVRVPAGEFLMGDPAGCPDERPPARVRIARPFWMGKGEVTNEQFALFDPTHDSRYFNRMGKDQSNRGIPMNGPGQPVVRVSWEQAMGFCRRLSAQTGRRVTLPTEAQWEWACRAGTASPLSYGETEADFSPFANVSDAQMAHLRGTKGAAPWRVSDARHNDGALVTGNVGRYRPNAWGLLDMHGNAAEWTRSAYRPYPYREDAAPGAVQSAIRNPESGMRMVVRGGSFHDRPMRCRSAFRLSYPAWQRVFNVGFRVVVEDAGAE